MNEEIVPRDVALYQIETELMELLALAEEPDLEVDERLAIDEQIAAYFSAEVRKVDGIAGTIRHCLSNAEIAKSEAARMAARAAAWDARAKRIKDSALYAMQAHGVKMLETPTNKLTVCGNGGLQPLEIFDEAAIPREHKTISVILDVPTWETIRDTLPTAKAGQYEIDNSSIRKSIGASAEVPGARLLERGVHLRLK